MENSSKWYKSKRIWVGFIGILTSISLLVTGEQSLQDPAFLSELILGGISFIQLIVGIVSGRPISFGNKSFYKGK